MKSLCLSVHDIVDVILRKGHLDNRIFNRASMYEGSRLHSLYQSEQGAKYQAEIPLEATFVSSGFTFLVNGKADGVIKHEDGSYTVEEIKTTVADLDEFSKDQGEWHLGQALFYACMLVRKEGLESIEVLLTYMKQNNYHIRKQIRKIYTKEELETFVKDILYRYSAYWEKVLAFKKERDRTVKTLPFPFAKLRNGQQKMMDFVTAACEKKEEVFIEAPTGIGKTVSTLYPYIKRFGEGKADRIFYLTGKNSIKKVAMETCSLFQAMGSKIKSIEFTSKESLCFNDKKGHCNPSECPFAKHYYDKLNDAVFDILNLNDCIDRKTLTDFCLARTICPFQFQLDASKYCDVLVLDYSYVYDVIDRLGLEESGIQQTHTLLLVDEAHNLPSRVRDMYSLEIGREDFREAEKICIGTVFSALREYIKDALTVFDLIPVNEEDEDYPRYSLFRMNEVPEKLELAIHNAILEMKDILKRHTDLVTDEFLSFFHLLYQFEELLSLYQEPDLCDGFLLYCMVDRKKKPDRIRISALDSRPLIEKGSNLFETVCYFSATLSPKDYYLDLLGGDYKDTEKLLVLDSPFPKENRRVFIDNRYSLYYRDRDTTLYPIYEEIKEAVQAKKGNYFVFVPSFEYLDALRSFFVQDPIEDADIFYQEHTMREEEREAFLSRFQAENTKTVVGVLVIGGVFSEGIDLVGNRLIGSIVISVGLPQIGFERDQLKKYYDKRGGEGNAVGFAYAYTYPGINRILQAAGRVIRTDTDKGFLLFIDSRLSYSAYRKIFDEIYPDRIRLYSKSQLRMVLKKFWEDTK